MRPAGRMTRTAASPAGRSQPRRARALATRSQNWSASRPIPTREVQEPDPPEPPEPSEPTELPESPEPAGMAGMARMSATVIP